MTNHNTQKQDKSKSRLVAVVGPTASGKSALAIRLARKFGGEVVSADSRQVYRGMDIGSGKVSRAERRLVPHHLLDVADPRRQYSASRFKRDASRAIAGIRKRGNLPILAGGTAFYVYSLVDDWHLPAAKPDAGLRKKLAALPAARLFDMLKKLDPARARTIDRDNPARLVRAIEIVEATGRPVPEFRRSENRDALLLGLAIPTGRLHRNIDRRVDERLKAGMVREVRRLLESGVSHRRLQSFGLEYKYVSLHLQGRLTAREMAGQLKSAIKKFAKRQMAWFKRDRRIRWAATATQAERIARAYLDGKTA